MPVARVQDKVCVITGAASGLGKCSAELLAGEGAKLVLADIDDAAGQALAAYTASMGEPEDIGWMVVYLASEETRHVNGSEMVVDNAFTAA